MRVVYFILLLVLLFLSCTEETEQTKPKILTLTESVYASVTVVPEELYNVYASSSGILEEVNIEEGDMVSKGALLAKVSAIDSEILLDDAELNLELAESQYIGKANNLVLIEDDILAARKQLALDSITYFRQKLLWEKQIGSLIDLEAKELKYTLSKNNLEQLHKRYLKNKIELDLQYQKSQNQLKKAKIDIRDYEIISRIDGRVYQLFKDPGEFIGIQEPLAQIGNANNFILEFVVDEVDIAKIVIGQSAYISLDAFGDTIYTAQVKKILPLKDERTQTYTVEAAFQDGPNVLYAGLSGEANILLSERQNVLTIPTEYLIDNDKVRTVSGDYPIAIGARNFTLVEVLSGIDTSTVIIKPQ